MSIVVNFRNEEEEKVLLAFLNRLHYNYEAASEEISLTKDQQQEIIRRDKAFTEGKTSARSWEEIKNDLEGVYR